MTELELAARRRALELAYGTMPDHAAGGSHADIVTVAETYLEFLMPKAHRAESQAVRDNSTNNAIDLLHSRRFVIYKSDGTLVRPRPEPQVPFDASKP